MQHTAAQRRRGRSRAAHLRACSQTRTPCWRTGRGCTCSGHRSGSAREGKACTRTCPACPAARRCRAGTAHMCRWGPRRCQGHTLRTGGGWQVGDQSFQPMAGGQPILSAGVADMQQPRYLHEQTFTPPAVGTTHRTSAPEGGPARSHPHTAWRAGGAAGSARGGAPKLPINSWPTVPPACPQPCRLHGCGAKGRKAIARFKARQQPGCLNGRAAPAAR